MAEEIAAPALSATTSVFSIATAHDTLLLATDAGVWRATDGRWEALAAPASLDFVAALHAADAADNADQLLIAAGLPAGIAYSPDAGHAWYAATLDLIDSSVSCIAASPRFMRDRVLLAGTEADGMLRSTDGGRSWRLANFGLTEFTILALVIAPSWDTREDAFVATDGGVYRSPNGGRAWKRCDDGLAGRVVQALLVSPGYAADRTLFAGCEDGPLYYSSDQGRRWAVLDQAPSGVNSMWAHPTIPGLYLAGTADGQIARSSDAGQTWDVVHHGNDAALTFATQQGIVYTGCYEGGLLRSADHGRTWQQQLTS